MELLKFKEIISSAWKVYKWFVLVIIFLIFTNYISCRNGKLPISKIDTVIKVDTFNRIKDTTIYKEKLVLVKGDSIPYEVPVYIDTTNKENIVAEYKKLLQKYQNENIYQDTFKLDSNRGYIVSTDTVQNNLLKSKTYNSHITYPTIIKTTTITKYAPEKSNIYLGVGVLGNQLRPFNGMELSLIYEDRKKQAFGLKVENYFFQPNIGYNFGISYHKSIFNF